MIDLKAKKYISRIKSFFKNLFIRKRISRANFKGSEDYWEHRYKTKRSSGAGSYGRLAEFKAEFINQFVKKNMVNDVIELGCGDGNQLSLANYNNYIGFDVSKKAIDICENRFHEDSSKAFYLMDDRIDYMSFSADMVMSLDVIYHLIEDRVYESYMEKLFTLSNKYVVIYSSNKDEEIDIHVKSRKFTNWIKKNISNQWELLEHVKNKYPFNSNDPNNTSMSDFYIYKKIE